MTYGYTAKAPPQMSEFRKKLREQLAQYEQGLKIKLSPDGSRKGYVKGMPVQDEAVALTALSPKLSEALDELAKRDGKSVEDVLLYAIGLYVQASDAKWQGETLATVNQEGKVVKRFVAP